MKKKILIGAVIIVVVLLFVTVSVVKSGGGGKVYGVKAKTIEKGNISSYVTANGFVECTEKAEIFFDTPMKVVKQLVEENQKVAKGQKLLELDMDSLYSELERLKVTRQTQQIALDAKALDAEISRAKSALDSAQRAYDDALKTYERNKSLYEASAISQKELDASHNMLLEAEAALKDARVGYDTAVSSKNLDSRTKSNNLKSTDLSIAELENQIRKINESLVSPIDGIIAEMNVQAGSYTSNMQPAFVIVNPAKLQVVANVREYDIKFIKVGQGVKITGEAIPEDVSVTGRVSSISPVAKTNRTTSGEEIVVEVVISVESSNAELKPGISVTCDISTSEKEGVLVAPMEMFDEDKDGNKFAYVVDTTTWTMRKTPVKLGISSDMFVEVAEGLKEGDTVILNPQPIYRDGARVKILSGEKK